MVRLKRICSMGEDTMFKILKVFILSIFCILPLTVLAKIPRHNKYFQSGDTFVCTTDALITIGDSDGQLSPSANGKVQEYDDVFFAITLLSNDKIDFSGSYPAGMHVGADDIFPINQVHDKSLHYGNDYYFGLLTAYDRGKLILKAFNISLARTVAVHASCEKL
jgi:hypothetical protein